MVVGIIILSMSRDMSMICDLYSLAQVMAQFAAIPTLTILYAVLYMLHIVVTFNAVLPLKKND